LGILEGVNYSICKLKIAHSTNVYFSILDKCKRPLGSIKAFLDELVSEKAESPFILSTYIDVYEEEAKLNEKPVDPAALEVKCCMIIL
jgi:hypothetical protein